MTGRPIGSLATAGFGTALGVIRALSEKGRLEACYCTETRPYNQVHDFPTSNTLFFRNPLGTHLRKGTSSRDVLFFVTQPVPVHPYFFLF